MASLSLLAGRTVGEISDKVSKPLHELNIYLFVCNEIEFSMPLCSLLISFSNITRVKQRLNQDQSKKGGKNQEAIKSSTKPDPGYQMGK